MRYGRLNLGMLALVTLALTGNVRAAVVSSLSTNFNGGAIPSGDEIWFSAVMKPGGSFDMTQTANIFMTNQTISFTANSVAYVLNVPDAEVTFNPGQTTANTVFTGGAWNTSTGYGNGNTFLAGLAFDAPVNLPGGIHNVTWQATFAGPNANDIHWQWSAATYNSQLFTGDYNALGVKASDDNHFYTGPNASDHAGTPELELADFIGGGATGGSGSNYTGSLSATASVELTPQAVPLPQGAWGGVVLAAVLGLGFVRRSMRMAA